MPPATDKSAHGSAAEHDALPPGMRFGELEILRILGVGGFGIVYLARDHALERDVALKEYMPASLASRGEGPLVSVRSGGFAETYAVGLRSFVNEARLLAKFDHPSLVKVYRFWEANGTAYMVMPYLVGRTLRDARKAMGKAPDEAWLRSVLDPILGALEVLHREGVYHRDIAPDNIWLQNDGPAILLDFGAARRVISDRTQSLTAILKPSYAPIEQYAEMSALRQGPWTDIYALGAVTHFLLAGSPPGPSTARALQDEMVPLWMRHYPGVSPRFLAAIDWALQVRPKERPQSVDELRAALDGRIEPPAVERHDNVHTQSGAAPLADAPTEFEPTRRVAGPGVSTTFEPTMRVAPPRPTQTQARPAAPVAPVPPSAVTAARTGATTTAATAAGAAVASPRPAAPPARSVAPPTAPAPLSAPAPLPAAGPAPAAGGMATGTKLAVAAAAIVLGIAAGAAVRYFGLFGGAAPGPVGQLAPAVPVAAAEPVPAPAAVPQAEAAPAVPVADPAPSAAVAMAPAPEAAAPAETRQRPAPREPQPAAPSEAPRVEAPSDKAAEPPPATEPRVRPAAPREVAAAPAPTPAPPPVPAGPATAREACGSRVLFALARCMERECQNPRFAQQAECVQLREQRHAREQR